MPPTTDKIPEKIPHDLYGTLVILTFLFTAGASAMLYDNLMKEWAFGSKFQRAEHITKLNNHPDTHQDLIDITKEDFEDWSLAAKHLYGQEQPFPVPENEWQWPKGFDPYKNPVKPNANNADPTLFPANPSVLTKEQHDMFMLNYNAAAPVAPTAPAAPAAGTPAAAAPATPAAPAADAAKPAEPAK